MAFARTAECELSGAGQAAWLDRVETEHDNIRSALRWALVAEPEIALDLAGTMWRFWLLRGYAGEGLDWIERSIGAADDAPSSARARALMGAGSMHEAIGDDEAAADRYQAGLRDWEALDDPSGIALAYRHLGNAGVGRGRYGEAIDWYERARRLGEELHDDGVIAGAVSNLGSVAYFQGDYGQAEEHWNEAAAFFRASSDTNRLASILNNLAELAALRGDPLVAVALHEQVLVLRQQLRDPIGLAQSPRQPGQGRPAHRRPGARQGAAGGRSRSTAPLGDRARHRRLSLQPGAGGPSRRRDSRSGPTRR